MIGIICAMFSGVSIVLSRQINGYLSQFTSSTTSTFLNYLTGLLTSIPLLILNVILTKAKLSLIPITSQPIILLGGVLSVINVFLLTILVNRISPLKLTLITFIAQIISGMIFDALFYQIISIKKIIGCIIVIIGMYIHTTNFKKVRQTSKSFG